MKNVKSFNTSVLDVVNFCGIYAETRIFDLLNISSTIDLQKVQTMFSMLILQKGLVGDFSGLSGSGQRFSLFTDQHSKVFL